MRREASKWRTELVLCRRGQLSLAYSRAASTHPFSKLSIDLVIAATQSYISRSVVAW